MIHSFIFISLFTNHLIGWAGSQVQNFPLLSKNSTSKPKVVNSWLRGAGPWCVCGGQRETRGVGSLLSPCGSWGWNPGCEAPPQAHVSGGRQVALPAEPSGTGPELLE